MIQQRVAADAFGEAHQRGLVGAADDVVGLPVTGLGPVVDRGGAGGDVGQSGPLVGMALLAAPAARAAHAEALAGGHLELAGVDRPVDRLDADPLGSVFGDEVSPDRLRRAAGSEFGGDPVTQRSGRRQRSGLGAGLTALGAAFGKRWPVAVTPCVRIDLATDRGWVTADAAGDHRPGDGVIVDQRDADLLAFGQ